MGSVFYIMNANAAKIKCLFNHHKYTIPHKKSPHILLCDHCMRFGYCKYSDGFETWYEYNEKGNIIHHKHSDGFEIWYDGKGNIIRTQNFS